MAAKLHSFIDIFEIFSTVPDTDTDADVGSVPLKKIIVPMIQRDYAQGRREPEIDRIRTHFLESLYGAVTGAPIILDFIYGDVDADGVMTPLDGQQRLTTLFLLHWYAAKKESVPASEYTFLKNFSYETRYSARDFCACLTDFTPSFTQPLSHEIVDQCWFPLDWKKDPTIASMLVMLDEISAKFEWTTGIWDKLKAGAVQFYFLPVKDMGLTDELYIKMNSRGKPLTQFEQFKAELERELRRFDQTAAERILKKIDRDWTELLWQYRDEDHTIDDAFLRYFKFICDIICYQDGGTPQGRSYDYDEFELLKQYFSGGGADALKNLQTLESYFDCWRELDGGLSPAGFLERFISYRHEPGKIQIDSRYKIDIFSDCLKSYADTTGRRRAFPLNRIILLYAVICYLLHKNEVTEPEFGRRLRIVNNLIQNSDFEISDSESRTSGNRIPAILRQVDRIIRTGQIAPAIAKSFSASQMAEETEKIVWLQLNPNLAETLFELEDHFLLQGQVGIIGLNNVGYSSRFASLFQCQFDKIDCALMAVGFYGQKEQSGGRYQMGSSANQQAWHNLFHKSSNIGFDGTSGILLDLLGMARDFTDSILDEISAAYIEECEAARVYSWRYYYIKYPVFRPGRYGKYTNKNMAETPYLFSVMWTRSKWSENTYLPFLKAADEKHLSRDDMGQRLSYPAAYIECENAAYVVRHPINGAELARIPVLQNKDGLDMEDRIMKLKNYLRANPDILTG